MIHEWMISIPASDLDDRLGAKAPDREKAQSASSEVFRMGISGSVFVAVCIK